MLVPGDRARPTCCPSRRRCSSGRLLLQPRAARRSARSPPRALRRSMLVDPVDRLLVLARRAPGRPGVAGPAVGVARGARRPRADDRRRAGRRASRRDDVRFAYREGRDVLHGVDLTARRASGWRSSGRPGRASRRSAGCWPASTRRAPARSTVGGVAARPSCRWTSCAARSRWSPRSTTSSSARCATTSRWPGRTPPTSELRGGAARGRRAGAGSTRCPTGSTPRVGSGGHRADARRRPSRSRWPGWSWPTRTRWCSTRRPRCSTRGRPGTSSGRSAPCCDGRTVVAIAHRLHTAHDADRVAVVEDGRITELGCHDELVAAGGAVRRAVAAPGTTTDHRCGLDPVTGGGYSANISCSGWAAPTLVAVVAGRTNSTRSGQRATYWSPLSAYRIAVTSSISMRKR